MENKEIGRFLHEERTRRGISLSLLARRLNRVSGSNSYTPAHIKLMEEGITTIGIKLLRNLCSAIGFRFYLVSGKETNSLENDKVDA